MNKESFTDRLTVIIDLGEIYISSIERQIAFKKYYLKSDKDIEDAKHMEELFKNNLDTGMGGLPILDRTGNDINFFGAAPKSNLDRGHAFFLRRRAATNNIKRYKSRQESG